MTNIDVISKILRNLQQKYNHLNNILNYTNEMETAARSDDSHVFGLLIEMRQKSMGEVDLLDSDNRSLLVMLPVSNREVMERILAPGSGTNTISLDNQLETNVYDTQKRINLLLSKIIAQDKKVNSIIIR